MEKFLHFVFTLHFAWPIILKEDALIESMIKAME